jgi:hypothetical protein
MLTGRALTYEGLKKIKKNENNKHMHKLLLLLLLIAHCI